ncbi:hypothetical protein FSP39_000356 [Pinctada imbricata]|uniref:Uncharacterized protein n=1 Tax=Pinctada imbricata TaxID=66713 RepID=A0AA89C9H2_PINIB|nr:hypothetical protein FSP39_000356 [Pinctada imbricata]
MPGNCSCPMVSKKDDTIRDCSKIKNKCNTTLVLTEVLSLTQGCKIQLCSVAWMAGIWIPMPGNCSFPMVSKPTDSIRANCDRVKRKCNTTLVLKEGVQRIQIGNISVTSYDLIMYSRDCINQIWIYKNLQEKLRNGSAEYNARNLGARYESERSGGTVLSTETVQEERGANIGSEQDNPEEDQGSDLTGYTQTSCNAFGNPQGYTKSTPQGFQHYQRGLTFNSS